MSYRVYIKGYLRERKRISVWNCRLVMTLVMIIILFSTLKSIAYTKFGTENKAISSIIVQQKKKNNKIEEKKPESNPDTVSKVENSDKESNGGICGGLCIFPILIIGAVFAVIIIAKIMKNISKKRAESKDKDEYEKYLQTEEKKEKEEEIVKAEYFTAIKEFKAKLNDSVSKLNSENLSNLKDEIQIGFDNLLKIQSKVMDYIDYSPEDPSIDLDDIQRGLLIKSVLKDLLDDIKADNYLDESEVNYLEKVAQLLGTDFYKYFSDEIQRLIILTQIKSGNIEPIQTDLNLKNDEKVYWDGSIRISNIIRNKLVYDKTDSKLYLTNENQIIQGIRTLSISLDSIVSLKDITQDLKNSFEVNSEVNYEDEDDENSDNEMKEVGDFKITYKPQSQFKEIQFSAIRTWVEVLEEFINYFTKQSNG